MCTTQARVLNSSLLVEGSTGMTVMETVVVMTASLEKVAMVSAGRFLELLERMDSK